MDNAPNTQAPRDPAIEFLADESHVPPEEVAKLYGGELTKLKADARVTAYLPIIAFRNVREMLRKLKAGKRSPPLVGATKMALESK